MSVIGWHFNFCGLPITHNADLSERRPCDKINLKSIIWFFNLNYADSRKRSWQKQAKGHPVDRKQNAVVMLRGPPPWPGSGRRFAPHAAGRPFTDHFDSEAQQSGKRHMASPGAGPAGRFSLCGPPSRDPLDMVPQHIRQFHERPSGGSSFQGNYPVGQLSGFTLRHCMPPGQSFSEPSSRGPSFQGPWQISSPSEFSHSILYASGFSRT